MQLKNKLKLGFKFILVPIFIIVISATLGFRNQDNSKLGKYSFLDACFDYISLNKDNEQLPSESKSNFKRINIHDLLSGIPDSVKQNTNSSKTDSLRLQAKQDSIKNKQNTAAQKNSGTDSLKLQTKQDSAKSKQNTAAQEKSGTDSLRLQTKQDSVKNKRTTEAPRNLRTDSLKLQTKIDSIKNKKIIETPKLSKADSLKLQAKQDSIKRIEMLSADSTARLKYFRFHHEDFPTVQLRKKKPSSFFANPSESNILRTVQLDSTGKKVKIKQAVAGNETRIPIEMPLDEYLQERLAAVNRDLWEKQGYDYKLKSGKTDFNQILTDITNIDIPLPSTPLLSIFGTPKINLSIRGQVDIHGAWRNETTTGITTSALGNTRNEPDFKQTVQINLNGTIGDKLTIGADWNTERTFSYENQLKIKYTGYEDEIVQSVEAGNVSLQTSSLVGGSEALFGVKAQFKMGPFSLTALASQKKSEVQEVSVSGGAKSQTFEIHAYNYSTNHYFIDSIYAAPNRVFSNYYGNSTPIANLAIYVKQIEVWKSTTGLYNTNERKANAFISLPRRGASDKYSAALRDSTLDPVNGVSVINTRFVLLQQDVDYTYHAETGFITFLTQIQDQDVIAVAFRLEGPTQAPTDDIFCGEFINDLNGTTIDNSKTTTRLVLKLIKPANLQPQYKKAWKLQLRNIYPIGGRSIKEEGFTMDIKYQASGTEAQNTYQGIKLIQAFGLDKTDKSKTGAADGAFDYTVDHTIFPKTGEIIFPNLQPFGDDYPTSLPDSLKYQSIYDTTVTFAQQDNSHDKFLLTGEYSASISSVYTIGFNVVENSVKVFLDGNQQKEGSDYTVDYNLGQIVIRNSAALVPGANLKITYEQNDLFQLASKTLIGMRGLYEFNKETTLGFSFLNLNQQTLSDKVRIGEEPLNNSIYGLDFKTNINLPFVTKALDKIISTSANSSLSINADYAYINPDPNTKKSTIASDDGKSVAYVDDFEGSKKIIPLGVTYGSWHDLSVPDKLPYIGTLELFDKTGQTDVQMNYKARTYWFTETPSDVTIPQIYGDRKSQGSPDQNQISVLDIVYDPTLRGTYNWFPSSTLASNPIKNWGGIMKGLSSTANNLIEQNIGFIEFWVKIINAPSDLKNCKINIDLGQISEDVIPNGKLDTEDFISPNSLLDDGEDIGMDGMKDVDEPGYDAVNNPDPSLDDYSYQAGTHNYSHVNGNEGNGVSTDLGRIPDTEDLNGNFTLDKLNSYFRYVVPLDTNKATNSFVQGGGDNDHWFLFRIPLKDYSDKKGDPSLSVVETIRFWFSGISEKVHLRLAEMNLVGNQWQKVLNSKVTIDDSVLTVSTINYEDNPDYKKPPGVVQEKDRTNPQYDIVKNEQSLNLIVKNLQDGDKREIVRYLTRTLDVFNYKEMKLFVHGDENNGLGSVSYFDSTTNNYGSEVYIRFGSDTLNYYEYRQPLKYTGVEEKGWDEISMKFSELTSIKQARDSVGGTTVYTVPVPGRTGHTYGVLGSPSLTKVAFFTIGITNPRGKGTEGQPVSGSVWIDELRVVEAEQTPGWAYSGAATLQLADLMRVNFNTSHTNPYFHKLNERFGSRDDVKSWGLSVDLDVLKLIPLNLPGSNMRVSYSRNESTTSPLFSPSTDIKISEAQNQLRTKMVNAKIYDDKTIEDSVAAIFNNAQTINRSETWSVSSFQIKIPTDVWYIRDIVNNISLSFNYNKTYGKSPTIAENSGWVWNAGANYSVNLSRELYFRPITIPLIGSIFSLFSDYRDLKIYFAPQSISSSLTANRKRNYTLYRGEFAKPNIQRDFITSRSAGFNWIITEGGLLNIALSYDLDIQSTLTYLLADSLQEFSEGQIWRSILSGAMFGKDYNYKQNFALKLSPKLPSIWDIDRYITLNGSYSSSYTWQNNFLQAELGRSAGYSSKLDLSLYVRLKSIFAPLFKEEAVEKPMQRKSEGGGRTGRRRSGGESNQQNQPPTGGQQPSGQNPPPAGGQNPPSMSAQQPSGQNLPPTSGQQPGQQNSRSVVNEPNAQAKMNPKSDSLAVIEETDSVHTVSPIMKTLEYLKFGIKYLLLDYDQITINFSQSNSYTGGGLYGEGTGFNNFWGFTQSSSKGPSRLFMLGLSNDIGPRALSVSGTINDTYSQSNTITFNTSKPLWEGADLKLDWKVGWGVNKSITMYRDTTTGDMAISGLVSTGTIDRSFLSLPPTLGNGIKKVHELYDPDAADPNKSLSNAFMQGFETFSFVSKIPLLSKFIKYIPRPNWNFTWTGLEKYELLKFASRITINHAYSSTYNEGWNINADGNQEIQSQKIDYGFTPLAGVSFNFDKFFGGALQSTFRYGTRSSYSLGISTRNITESFNRDVSFSASFTKTGFEIPLFGVSFKNDLEISLSYTNTKTSSVVYKMDTFSEAGEPLEGKTSVTIEPKIKYVMSSSVTLSIFYRRTTIEPEGSSRISPTTTNEAGVDVRIAIQPR